MDGEPVRPRARVDRVLSLPQRVDVGMIGGEASRHLGTGNSKTAGELLTTRLLAPSRPAETVVLRTTLNVRASSTPMATALCGIRQA